MTNHALLQDVTNVCVAGVRDDGEQVQHVSRARSPPLHALRRSHHATPVSGA